MADVDGVLIQETRSPYKGHLTIDVNVTKQNYNKRESSPMPTEERRLRCRRRSHRVDVDKGIDG